MSPDVILLFSADNEWQSWLDLHQGCKFMDTPFGECFEHTVDLIPVLSMQGGWGKVSAAASSQWAIDRYQPDLIVNLGTCGGMEGRIDRHTIVLVEKTWQYDIHEQMTDPDTANRFYSCDLDLSWLGERQLPEGTVRETMYSADRDILPADVAYLIAHHAARVADWESGAIAWVAERNHTSLLILRGVSDLVSPTGGESYDNIEIFQKNTRKIIEILAGQLPWWLHSFIDGSGVTSRA